MSKSERSFCIVISVLAEIISYFYYDDYSPMLFSIAAFYSYSVSSVLLEAGEYYHNMNEQFERRGK